MGHKINSEVARSYQGQLWCRISVWEKRLCNCRGMEPLKVRKVNLDLYQITSKTLYLIYLCSFWLKKELKFIQWSFQWLNTKKLTQYLNFFWLTFLGRCDIEPGKEELISSSWKPWISYILPTLFLQNIADGIFSTYQKAGKIKCANYNIVKKYFK